MTVKVHFDGKVFVPDQSVNLPSGFVANVVYDNGDVPPATAVDPDRRPISAIITGVDPEVVRAIGQDPEFDLENA